MTTDEKNTIRGLFSEFDVRFIAADLRILCRIPPDFKTGTVSPEKISYLRGDEVIRVHSDGTVSHLSKGTVRLWES